MPNRRKPKHSKLRIGITIGDVSGIGPELIIQAFQDPALVDMCIPIVYGSSRVINIYRKVMGVESFHYIMVQKPSQAQNRKLNVIDCVADLERIDIGKPSEASGLVAYEAVKRAVEDAQHQELDAMITMPVDKASFQRHDERFTGHTELLAEAFNVQDNLMLMVSEELRVGLVTNHVAIQDVARNISVDKIFRKGLMLNQTLKEDFGITQPRIAILGLNPHAGDSGLIGKEEEEVIAPAIRELKNKGVKVMGPYPADGFFGSLTYRKFDGVLAMYHDQGLVPFKLIAGYRGVNYTAGMPFIRTSPDHGVAYDIAGKNIANAESLREALYLAIDIYHRRSESEDLQDGALKPIDIKEMKAARAAAVTNYMGDEDVIKEDFEE